MTGEDVMEIQRRLSFLAGRVATTRAVTSAIGPQGTQLRGDATVEMSQARMPLAWKGHTVPP